jgi:hypothetical protein
MKKYKTTKPWANVIKLFWPNKLEFLSQLISVLVSCLWVRLGAYTRVEHLKDPLLR